MVPASIGRSAVDHEPSPKPPCRSCGRSTICRVHPQTVSALKGFCGGQIARPIAIAHKILRTSLCNLPCMLTQERHYSRCQDREASFAVSSATLPFGRQGDDPRETMTGPPFWRSSRRNQRLPESCTTPAVKPNGVPSGVSRIAGLRSRPGAERLSGYAGCWNRFPSGRR